MNKPKLFKDSHKRLLQIIFIVASAIILSAGIIKAATTIGNNIATDGTITGGGVNTLYGATSIGGALTATSTLTVNGLSIFNSNVGIGTSSPYAKLSVVGETVSSYFTATSTTATSIFTGGINVASTTFAVDKSSRKISLGSSGGPYSYMGIFGDATSPGYGNLGVIEAYGQHTGQVYNQANAYANTIYSESDLSGDNGAIMAFASNIYAKQFFRIDSGSETFTDGATNLLVTTSWNGGAGTSYTIGELAGATIRFGEATQNMTTNNITTLYGLDVDDNNAGIAKGSGTYNVSGNFITIRAGNMNAMASGTVAVKSGLWVEPQSIGTTNYGIVLDGNGSGSDIVFGTNREAKISYDGSNLVYNSNPIATTNNINDLGTKSVCSAWASVVNPYMCIGWLNQTGSGNETELIRGDSFVYSNYSSSEFTKKAQAWTLNPAGGNESLSRADSTTSYGFVETGTNGFAVMAWVEVVDSSGQYIIAKRGSTANAQREWSFQIDANEKLIFSLIDESAGVLCSVEATSAISPLNNWYLLGFVYTGASGGGVQADNDVTLYVNGQAVSDVDATCTGYVTMDDGTQSVTIGQRGDSTNYFLGDMGNIMIVSTPTTAVTADQVLKLYNNSKMYYGL